MGEGFWIASEHLLLVAYGGVKKIGKVTSRFNWLSWMIWCISNWVLLGIEGNLRVITELIESQALALLRAQPFFSSPEQCKVEATNGLLINQWQVQQVN